VGYLQKFLTNSNKRKENKMSKFMNVVRSKVKEGKKDEQSIAKARDKMIAGLDTVRPLLEEISPELGVTDPVAGPVIMEDK
jgi:hypothetical protein